MGYKHVPDHEEAPKVLLLGLPGAGKTDQIASLLEAGLEVFVVFTEQGRESLLKGVKRRGLDMGKLHYTRVGASTPGFKSLKKLAKIINQSTQKEMQSQKGLNERDYQQMLALLEACGNFVDQHGVSYGDASEWGNDRVLVIDGLSGINRMALDLVVGGKPIRSISDWGIAMDTEMSFILQCVNDLICGFVLIGHLEINRDEVEGKVYTMPKLLGNKNTADFGSHFGEVILAEDLGAGGYNWSTQSKKMQLKHRLLPRSSKIKPGFKQLWDAWADLFEKPEGENV